MSVPATHYRFTVDAYHRMGEADILGPDDRVELVDGQVVMKAPIGSRHAACVDRCTHFFARLVGDRAIVRVQNPIQLDDYSEPEPDVGRRCIDAYRGPLAGGYAERRTCPAGEKLRPAALDVEVAVDDLLP